MSNDFWTAVVVGGFSVVNTVIVGVIAWLSAKTAAAHTAALLDLRDHVNSQFTAILTAKGVDSHAIGMAEGQLKQQQQQQQQPKDVTSTRSVLL